MNPTSGTLEVASHGRCRDRRQDLDEFQPLLNEVVLVADLDGDRIPEVGPWPRSSPLRLRSDTSSHIHRSAAPRGWRGASAAPNPFRAATTLHLYLPATIRNCGSRVFDAGGRLVRGLQSGPMTAGDHVLCGMRATKRGGSSAPSRVPPEGPPAEVIRLASAVQGSPGTRDRPVLSRLRSRDFRAGSLKNRSFVHYRYYGQPRHGRTEAGPHFPSGFSPSSNIHWGYPRLNFSLPLPYTKTGGTLIDLDSCGLQPGARAGDPTIAGAQFSENFDSYTKDVPME